MDIDKTRAKLLAATLAHVPFDGWTGRALRAGAADAGLEPASALNAFPGGPAELLEWFSAEADRRSAVDKSFILDLFPTTPFYASLLDPSVAADLGHALDQGAGAAADGLNGLGADLLGPGQHSDDCRFGRGSDFRADGAGAFDHRCGGR